MRKTIIFQHLFAIAGVLLCAQIAAQPTSQTYTTPGSHTFTVLDGYTANVKVEVWGGGGGGGGDVDFPSYPGSGGGGGAYASKNYTLTAGNYSIYVGMGGSGYNATNAAALPTAATPGEKSIFYGVNGDDVIASGGGPGSGGANAPGGFGGQTTSCLGTVIFAGGNGGAMPNILNSNQMGGGGGGSATTSGAGGDGNVNNGGTGQGNGGNGGANTPNPGTAAQNGAYPGGGGGGKAINLLYLTGGDGAGGQVIVTVDSYISLPVNFGHIQTSVQNNQVTISFSTLQETNNDHFNIQASTDGENFETVATVKSKSRGTSTGPATYTLSLNLTNKYALGFSLAALLGISLIGFKSSRRRILSAVLSMGILGAVFVSCSRNASEELVTANSKIYLRIQQVNKDGSGSFSKIITVRRD